MKLVFCFVPAVLFVVSPSAVVFAHCEIPCGIYDDPMRLEMIAEDIKTVAKAITSIKELSKEKEKNYNQIVRWIVNKEEHAEKIQRTAWQYFMAQRVKPADEADKDAYREYIKKLTLLHKLIVYAMKAKQGTEIENVANLKKTLADFREAYLGKKHELTPHPTLSLRERVSLPAGRRG